MHKKRILISALGSPFFPYMKELLGGKYELTLIDANRMVKTLYQDRDVVVTPVATHKDFIPTIKRLITRNKIDYYVPMVDEEIVKILSLSKTNNKFRVIAPNNLQFVKLCLNKFQLMNRLAELNISHVKTYLGNKFNHQFDFPVFVKPVVGRGSRGAQRINNQSQLTAYFELAEYRKDQVMIQEYLDGEEFSVSVVVNNLNKLIAVVPKKIILKKGTTIHAMTQRNQIITDICRKVVTKMNPRGVFNVQLKLVGQKAYIFEINPRCSGTTPLTCQAGINEIDLCIKAYDKRYVDYNDSFKQGLYLYRRWENIFYS